MVFKWGIHETPKAKTTSQNIASKLPGIKSSVKNNANELQAWKTFFKILRLIPL